ncbi:Odorant receptor 366 [Nylanderia fulva]|uniref:Odorant receptor n=1 Tax=Nylanderia fulva TaxID=613905 RepID=A0A6G1LQA0_9HYME|nr:Odorant receptor 366 [Nylanderia fulva]
MTSLDLSKHFSTNRILLLLIGVWPYERSFLIEFQFILLYSIITTFIVFQFYLLHSFYYFLIKYNSFWINADVLRSTMKQFLDICNEIKDENEITIIKKYGSKAKRFTIIIILLGLSYQFGFILLQLWPHIYYIIATNISRPRSTHILTEYFIDQEKYSYLIMLHTNAASCIGALAMASTGALLITYLQHTCAMFSIACYRIEQAIRIVQKGGIKNEQKCCQNIIGAVNIHCEAMKLSHFLISNFVGSFFSLIAAGLFCLSCNLLQIVSVNNSIEQILLSLFMVSVHYTYLFLSNHIAQEITDHNEYLFITVYNVNWYKAPIRVQKMILFLLQKGTKSFNLVLGGIFVASMKSAASLLSTSISYFTVLYSVRQD